MFNEGTTSTPHYVTIECQMRNNNFEDWWSNGPGDGYKRH